MSLGIGVCLIGVYLMSVHLMGVYLVGVHLIGMYLMGMHLMGMHLVGMHLMGMYLVGMHLSGKLALAHRIRANAVSDPVRGYHRGCHWDHQKYSQFVDNEMQGNYSGLSTCN